MVQTSLFSADNFGPEHMRIHFVEDIGKPRETITVRLGIKWADPELVGQPIDVCTGFTKSDSASIGHYLVRSISVMKFEDVPAAWFKKIGTPSCKRNPVTTLDYLRTRYTGRGEITGRSIVTVMHLAKDVF